MCSLLSNYLNRILFRYDFFLISNAQNFLAIYTLMMYWRSQYEKIDQENATTVSFFRYRFFELDEKHHNGEFRAVTLNIEKTDKNVCVFSFI